MGKNKKKDKEFQKNIQIQPKYKIDIVPVDKAVTKNSSGNTSNSFVVSDGSGNSGKGYCITLTQNGNNENAKSIVCRKKKRRRIFIREILNIKTNQKRLEVSTSNWTSLAEKPKTVDAATSPVHKNDLFELEDDSNTIKELYPNASFYNREKDTRFLNEFDDDIMELLKNDPFLGPSPETRLTPVLGASGPAENAELTNLSYFNEDVFV